MVGKGDATSSRIFHQCYLKCCKLQNLTPLNAVIPGGNGKVLDFCVDRIKYQDWPPILNALSCDLSLHSISVRCRQQVKTVLEHIDCERLAKTVNKRAVILTNFMLSNLIEASTQLLSNTTLLTSLLLEGLPLKIPYLNPLCEALLTNNSLQHIYLPRCLVGDAGCLAVCKAVRCLPNILTLDLSGCDLTALGASYIADLIKYQKIHRYSENWIHTLRYRLPELDAMSGLRRITLCANPQLGDAGVCKLLDVLADDLWIKALDVQNCGLSDLTASAALHMLQSNTTVTILDMRHNADVSSEWLSKVRAGLRENERGVGGQYSWLGNASGTTSSDGRSVKSVISKNGIMSRDRLSSNTRTGQNKYVNKTNVVKKEKDYSDTLEEQLQEEISHRQQLEELNLQLVDQMKQLKQQQIRLWANGGNGGTSSGSEQSVQASSRSCDLSSSSGSSSSVPIDQNTLSYIQQAFKDIYAFIKNNQCHGQCLHEGHIKDDEAQPVEVIREVRETEEIETTDLRVNISPKKAQSSHIKLVDVKMSKTTKSAHMLGDSQHRDNTDMKPEMIERQMGDSKNAHGDDQITVEDFIATQTKANKKNIYETISPCSSIVSDSSETLVCSPESSLAPNPREALYSSTSDDESS
ncbi:protein Cep78 homolog [Pectinophora gossypiella]|uniref:protein Cep78 homolog n=1 Tax=Pectinophora gossypiella TaxID=13191 RepID=UPI00214F5E03|nr:protein Cep78 homolog [Pectinophora gossypiella]